MHANMAAKSGGFTQLGNVFSPGGESEDFTLKCYSKGKILELNATG
jgi:hypothetical protein